MEIVTDRGIRQIALLALHAANATKIGFQSLMQPFLLDHHLIMACDRRSSHWHRLLHLQDAFASVGAGIHARSQPQLLVLVRHPLAVTSHILARSGDRCKTVAREFCPTRPLTACVETTRAAPSNIIEWVSTNAPGLKGRHTKLIESARSANQGFRPFHIV